MKLIICVLALFVAATGVDAQVYGYNIQVHLSGSGYKHQGKLKLYFEGTNFEHKVVLSPKTETLAPGVYNYVSSAPAPIDQITSVSLDWSKKPFNLNYKISVDKIVITPGYIQDPGMRQKFSKTLCSGQRPQSVTAGKKQKLFLPC